MICFLIREKGGFYSKRAVFPIDIRFSLLNRILAAAPPHVGLLRWYAHTRGLRTRANVPCVDRQAGGAVLDGWPLLWASHARCRGGPLPALAPAACEGLRRSGQRCWPLAWAKMFRGGCIPLLHGVCVCVCGIPTVPWAWRMSLRHGLALR